MRRYSRHHLRLHWLAQIYIASIVDLKNNRVHTQHTQKVNMTSPFKALLKATLAAVAAAAASASFAQVTFFQDNNYQGAAFSTERAIGDFQRFGFMTVPRPWW